MHVERHAPSRHLRPFLLGSIEGWEQVDGSRPRLREVPFPGVPLIFGLETAWQIDGPIGSEREESFVAGMHAGPTFVQPESRTWSCIELRLTPVAAHRILGLAMHELSNRTVAIADVVPETGELAERLRSTRAWSERFGLVEEFLLRRLALAPAPAQEVLWSWEELRRTSGRAPIAELAGEIGWSHRRLIARFREQVGVGPKTVARVMRFDRAVQAVRSSEAGLAEVAFDTGYFDQAHMNREFQALGGTTPGAFRGSLLESGGVAA
jgi:AraC-like DNA-binding protein